MSVTLAPREVERFRALVGEGLGLLFEDDKVDLLAEVCKQRMADSGCARADDYLRRLEDPAFGRQELRLVAEQLTVGETYFLRNPDHFRVFTEVVLPECARSARARTSRSSPRSQGPSSSSGAARSQPQLRILSAGCSTGAEAYSIAMLVRDHLPDLADYQLTIRAIDVNPAVIAKAIVGRYSAWALRQTPAEIQRRWFHPADKDFVVDDSIREMVTFEERNLIEADRSFWQEGSYDVVFCRNVLMYFSAEVARAVVDRIARALVPGGYLFLGHAETLRGVSEDFHLRQTHETFYYQRREAAETRSPHRSFDASYDARFDATPDAPYVAPYVAPHGAPPHAPSSVPSHVPLHGVAGRQPERSEDSATSGLLPPEGYPSDSWVDLIQGVTDRAVTPELHFRAPLLSEAGEIVVTTQAAASPATWDLGVALQLMREEKFGEAMDVLATLPTASLDDPDALLLRAVLLTNAGDSLQAESVCKKLLLADELHAGAHYVMALCREHAGDSEGALEHDRSAQYLDPTFAMPHLHSGLISKRAGNLETARREFGHALLLLAREDTSRILLFGGGFNRGALAQLCHTSLRACGGAT